MHIFLSQDEQFSLQFQPLTFTKYKGALAVLKDEVL